MPPTATCEDIKTYQDRVEKNEITPHGLPPCPICNAESRFFKIHAYRERWFLIIVEMIVDRVCCALVRFACPGCGKTVTFYPDFALPHKRYTRQSIMGFAGNYVADENATYEKAVMVEAEKATPGYCDGERSLAPSTVHRWVASLSRLKETTRTALDLIRQEDPDTNAFRVLAQPSIPPSKYRSALRKERLLDCFRLFVAEACFKVVFHLSIFTELARALGFT